MKKFTLFVMMMAFAVALVGCGTTSTTTTTTTTSETACHVDVNGVCVWNNGNIEWETGKVVTVGVDTLALAEGLEEAWNAAFPTLSGKLDAVVYEASDSETSGVTGVVTMQGEAPDVVLIIGSGSVGREVNFLDLDNYMGSVIDNDVLQSALNSINSGDKVHYLPGVYDGMAFAWNKTMLEQLISSSQLDITLADADNNNLPDAFDTWEEIFALAQGESAARMTFQYTKDGDTEATTQTIYEWFPLVLAQEWGNYFAYSIGGWELFPDNNPIEPGFDSAQFLAGLNFIKTYGEMPMSFQENGEKMTASQLIWRFDNFLKNEYPFGLVGTWMDVATNENTYNSDFVFSQMPSYNGITPTPIVKTKGFAVNAYTDCPGAAVTVMKFLYSQAGMTAIADNSAYLLALEADSNLLPATLSENQVQYSIALGFGFNEPAMLLPLSDSTLAVQVLYNSGIVAAQGAVYDGTMTIQDAQTAIMAAAEAWIAINNVAE